MLDTDVVTIKYDILELDDAVITPICLSIIEFTSNSQKVEITQNSDDHSIEFKLIQSDPMEFVIPVLFEAYIPSTGEKEFSISLELPNHDTDCYAEQFTNNPFPTDEELFYPDPTYTFGDYNYEIELDQEPMSNGCLSGLTFTPNNGADLRIQITD